MKKKIKYMGGGENYKKWCNGEISYKELRRREKDMIGGEDDPRLVDKNVPLYVPMEDAPGLIDKSFEDFVDEFLYHAEVIYRALEAEDHRLFYMLLGKTVEVKIRRLSYDKHSKDLEQDAEVGKEEGDESERESEAECCKED